MIIFVIVIVQFLFTSLATDHFEGTQEPFGDGSLAMRGVVIGI